MPGDEVQPNAPPVTPNVPVRKVRVKGPDGNFYRFPAGTDKAGAVAFFKKKGIGGKKKDTPVAAPADNKPPDSSHPPGYDALQHAASAPGPDWAKETEIAKDPTWYGRSGRYLGGELVGVDNALIGAGAGFYKLAYDLASVAKPRVIGTDKPQQEVKTAIKNVGGDIAGGGKGAVGAVGDGMHLVWNFLQGHPEVAADPVKFGEKVANAAMTIDGGVKLARSLAGPLGMDALADAQRVSDKVNGSHSTLPRMRSLETAYVHAKGLKISKQFGDAVKNVNEEVKKHASHLDDSIDQAAPGGVIDATATAKTISDAFDNEVKTNERIHPAIKQVYDLAKSVRPGQWTFEQVRQLRSAIGRAQNVPGPQGAVLGTAYGTLTKELAGTAKKFGLEDSWNHYNELQRKFSNQFEDYAKDVHEAPVGQAVADKLLKNKASTREVINNLQKYGLDSKEVAKYMKDAARIGKDQGKYFSLFRLATGSPMAAAGYVAGHLAGGGFMGGVAAGAVSGFVGGTLVNLARDLRLPLDVVEDMLDQRELPGYKNLPAIKKPPSIAPQAPKTSQLGPPQGPQNVPPAPKGLPPKINAPQAANTPQLPNSASPNTPPVQKQLPAPKIDASPSSESSFRAGTSPEVTKVEEGKYGKSKLSKQARDRDRIAKKREAVAQTHQAEAKEAEAKALATNIDVTHISTPELEQFVRDKNPVMWSAIQKVQKMGKLQGEMYEHTLREAAIRIYEQGLAVKSKE